MSISEMKMRKDTERKLEAIRQAYKEEGPITLRRAYYVLLSRGFFDLAKSRNPNHAKYVYQSLSRLLVDCREKGILSADVIVDREREFIKRLAFKTFDECFADTFENYVQDSMIGQKRAVEVWIEKDTMRTTYLRDCYFNDVPLVISKGFTSWTFKNEAVQRFKNYGKPVTILYFGDFDYEGEYIPALINEFVREHIPGLDFEFRKVLLTKEDYGRLKEYAISFETNKKQLEKAYVRDFIARYGAVKLEVEALPFSEVRRRLKEELARTIDLQIVSNTEERADKAKRAWIRRHYRA